MTTTTARRTGASPAPELSQDSPERGMGIPRHQGLLLGYMRVSTARQDERNGHGIQRDALLQAGVDEEYLYSDVITGKSTAAERSGFAAMMAMARRGDTVVAWRLDRLGRSMVDVINTVAVLRERGVEVRTISDGIDSATSNGRLMLGMLATLAEYERELIQERVQAGVTRKKTEMKVQGKTWGRQPKLPLTGTQEADRLDAALTLMGKGRTGRDAAAAVGWSRSTLYRFIAARRELELAA
jgi:DNA invertase Pin-like site-specific DNA recombinase